MCKCKESKRSTSRSVYWLISAALLCLSWSFYSTGEESDMFSWFSWFKKKEAYLSPEVKGVVKEKGEPLAHIQVTRQLTYNLDEIERVDTVSTDDKGQFYFPEKTLMSRLAANPMAQQRVSQYIYIERDNKKYQLWGASQTAYKEIPEYSHKLAWLACDLSNRLMSFEFKRNEGVNMTYVATSICNWEDDYMPYMLYHENGKKYLINNGDLNDLEEH